MPATDNDPVAGIFVQTAINPKLMATPLRMLRPACLLSLIISCFFSSLLRAQGGNTCATAQYIEPGTHRSEGLVSGNGAFRPDARHARWFAFVPPADGLLSVSSCGGGADTRLQIYRNNCGAATWWVSSDDACDIDGTNATRNTYAAAVAGLFVETGDTILIEWDDHWDNNGFDWELTFREQPTDGGLNPLSSLRQIPAHRYPEGFPLNVQVNNRGSHALAQALLTVMVQSGGSTILQRSTELPTVAGKTDRDILIASLSLKPNTQYLITYILNDPMDTYSENDTLRQTLLTTENTYAQDAGLTGSLAGSGDEVSQFGQLVRFDHTELLKGISVFRSGGTKGDSLYVHVYDINESGPAQKLRTEGPFLLTSNTEAWQWLPLETAWPVTGGFPYLIAVEHRPSGIRLQVGSSEAEPAMSGGWRQTGTGTWQRTADFGLPANWLIRQHLDIPTVPVTLSVQWPDSLKSEEPLIVLTSGSDTNGPWTMEAVNDSTWQYRTNQPVGDTLRYRFVRSGNGFTERVPNACSVVGPDGENWRQLVIPQGGEAMAGPVCWSRCTPCSMDPACVGADLLRCETFDQYALGTPPGTQAPWWVPQRPAEDGVITAQQFVSPPHALYLDPGGRTRTALQLPDLSSGGIYRVEMQIRVPQGTSAGLGLTTVGQPDITPYFGLLLGTDPLGQASSSGQGYTLPNRLGLSYPPEEWFSVVWLFDMNRRRLRCTLNGNLIDEVSLNEPPTEVRFFSPNRSTEFFVDDVRIRQLGSCQADALVCESFEWYFAGQAPSGPVSDWLRSDTSGIVANDRSGTGAHSLYFQRGSFEQSDLFLGGFQQGRFDLQWQQYLPASQASGLQLRGSNGVPFFNLLHNRNGQRGGEAMVGTFEAFYPYPESQWIDYRLIIDFSLRTIDVLLNGETVVRGFRFRKNDLGYLTFFVPNAFGQFWVDDIQLRSLPALQSEVTFGVDLSRLPQGSEQAFLVGSFNDWTPIPMEPRGNGRFTTSLTLPAGDTIGFAYLNESQVREPDDALLECGLGSDSGAVDRLLIVGAQAMDLGFPCYGFCSPCSNVTSTSGAKAPEVDWRVFPNPAWDRVQVDWPSQRSIQEITVTDLTGRTVWNTREPLTSFSVFNWPRGTYFITIHSDGYAYTRKLMR
jgi:hypothetical protein